jgi:phosphatidylethanolamine-binding protein (PEBP) family uncharacterized protein
VAGGSANDGIRFGKKSREDLMRAQLHATLLFAAGGMLLAPCISSTADAQAPSAETGFVLTSTTFKDGGLVPTRIAFKANAEFPNCFGENVSPQLAWAHPRAGVKSFAITMFEMEDPPHVDLVAYGIPASVSSFEEGELSKPSDKYIGGTNFRKMTTWRGMCPPPGTATHHYNFTIRGTDLDPKALSPGLTAQELDARLEGHVKGTAVLVGMFARPK